MIAPSHDPPDSSATGESFDVTVVGEALIDELARHVVSRVGADPPWRHQLPDLQEAT